jgi:hypothetical protein
MYRKGESKLGVASLIGIFILIIVGIALLQPTSNTVDSAVNLQDVSNESLSITTARYDAASKSINESLNYTLTFNFNTISAVRNGSSSALTAGTDYVIDTNASSSYTNCSSAGILRFMNTSVVVNGSNTTYIDYNYVSGDYVCHAASRTITNLIPLFFVIGLFIFVAWWGYKKYGELGY